MRKSLLLFALLALVSCEKEYDYFGKETDLPGSDLVDVSFNLSPDKMAIDGESTETKSQMASSADDAFNGAILFAFDHSTGKIKLDDNGAPYIKTVTTKDFSWSLPQNETMDIYTIVNYEGNVQGVDALISNKSLTVSELTQLTFTCKTVSGITNIPMSGINNNVKLTKTNNTVSIAAKRVFAKYMFKFNLSELNAAGYKVTATSLSACQSNSVIPLFYTGTGAGYKQNDASNMVIIDNATSSDLSSLSAGGTVPLYFLENCQGNKSGAAHWYDVETSGMSGLELCSYILVNVTMSKSGDQTAQSYKVYLGSDCTTNFDVVRNSSRTISMTLHAPTAPPQVVTYRMKSASLTSYSIQVGGSATASSLKEKYINGVASGETIPASATYVSSDPTIATVNATSGVITGITPGTVTITATDSSCESGFQSVNTATLTVSTAPDNVTWRMKSASLASYSIQIGGSTTASAVKEKYVNGVASGETATASATWISNSPTIASINYNTGVVTGQIIGSATFTATDTSCETGYQTAVTPSLTVSAVPETVTWRMKSAAPEAYSIPVGGNTTITALKEKYVNGVASGETTAATPTWTSGNPAVATIGASSGVVTGVKAGSATFTGIDSSCEAGYQTTPDVTITVYDDVTWRMKSATLDSYSITVGGTAKASAVKEQYLNGSPTGTVVPATVTWSSSNSTVATIDSYGNVSGKTIGSAFFTATDMTCESGYQSATTPSLTVAAVPDIITWRLKSASLASYSISVGGTTTASAVKEKYVNGSASGETAMASVTWTSSNSGVATIGSTTGVVAGVAAGTATFTATDSSCESEHRSATTSPLTVTYTPTVTWRLETTSLTFTPDPVLVGNTATCDQTILKRKYEDGIATSVTTAATLSWSSNNTSVATVSGGTVTGQGAGTATITATDSSCESEYRSASGSINVNTPYVPTVTWRLETTSLTFTPDPVLVGNTATCDQTILKRKYEDGIATSVTTAATLSWSSNNTSVATVSGGTVTGQGAGTATITATDSSCESEYRSASGSITVNALDVITYDFYITPSSKTLEWGETQGLTAYAQKKVNGVNSGSPTAISASDVFWSTNNSAVAQVNVSGTVTAQNKNGSATITGTLKSTAPNYSDFNNTSDTSDITVNTTVTSISISRTGPTTLTNQAQVDLLCSVTLSNGASYNSDSNWTYFAWYSPDEGPDVVQKVASEWSIGASCTIYCDFVGTNGSTMATASVAYTVNSYTYTLVNSSLVQVSANGTYATYKIVCTIRNDQTSATHTVDLYNDTVIDSGLTLTPDYETGTGGTWGASDNICFKGYSIKAYVNGSYIGAATYNP